MFSYALPLLLSLSTVVSADLGKPVAFPGPSGLPYTTQLLNFTEPHSPKIVKNPAGMIPAGCRNEFNVRAACPIWAQEFYNVTYDDCAVPWYICRCENSPIPAQTLAENIGRIPVTARQFLGNAIAYKDNSGKAPESYTTYSDVVFTGDVKDIQGYLRAVLYNLDYWWWADLHPVQPSGNLLFSDSQTWKETLDKAGTCVADDVANKGYLDALTEVWITVVYGVNAFVKGLSGGKLYPDGPACLQDSWSVVDKYFGQPANALPVQKCWEKLAVDTIVNSATGQTVWPQTPQRKIDGVKQIPVDRSKMPPRMWP